MISGYDYDYDYVCRYWMQPSNRAETKVQYQSASVGEPNHSPTVLTGWTTLHLLELHGSGNSVSLVYRHTLTCTHTHTQTALCADTLAGYYLLAYVHS